MRTVRIYQSGTYALHDLVELSEPASHHVLRVLRMRASESLTLFCGDNQEFSARIIIVKKHRVTVRIEGVQTMNRESPCIIHLAQGIAKKEHMPFIIQKAVELGVASITPLITHHSAVKHNPKQLQKKHAQWSSIAIGACEQSGRNILPPIHPSCTINNYLEACDTSNPYILDPKADITWKDLSMQPAGDITLLIGPEGGLSPQEISTAKQAGFKGISLGPRILRTETATLAALSVLQALLGDL
ncbi:MAG: 16S rRNA (uracil(1498)-N(3))-methyltransferase [Legionellaceae bacterium]|nr:16S rRNA (uracil(1498)-N(3))-methyltransferase [Legionellaceae bacterium]